MVEPILYFKHCRRLLLLCSVMGNRFPMQRAGRKREPDMMPETTPVTAGRPSAATAPAEFLLTPVS